ncbi:serotriflin-like [Paroedura picta]|uniref:serotriflin-like n=1 Tax=Paroedura picta TaxID=143630 RepID=UPI0040575A7F
MHGAHRWAWADLPPGAWLAAGVVRVCGGATAAILAVGGHVLGLAASGLGGGAGRQQFWLVGSHLGVSHVVLGLRSYLAGHRRRDLGVPSAERLSDGATQQRSGPAAERPGGDLAIGVAFFVAERQQQRRSPGPAGQTSWNETIGENARIWAEKCESRSSPLKDRTFGDTVCGESIFQTDYLFAWSEVLNYWQNKSHHFKYGFGATDTEQSIYGYTQAVWYRSNEIGCSIAQCQDKEFEFIYICQYCPAGNILEQIETPYKRGPPCGDCPKHCDEGLCTNPCKYTDFYKNCEDMKSISSCKRMNKTGKCNATCRCRNRIK